jgi:hypothetical protein
MTLRIPYLVAASDNVVSERGRSRRTWRCPASSGCGEWPRKRQHPEALDPPVFKILEAKMHRKGVECFAAVGEVDDNCTNSRRVNRLQVKVQDLWPRSTR